MVARWLADQLVGLQHPSTDDCGADDVCDGHQGSKVVFKELIDQARQRINEIADEAILLAAKVIEVNAHFFTRTVMPKLDGLFTQAKSLAAVPPTPTGVESGSMPSNS